MSDGVGSRERAESAELFALAAIAIGLITAVAGVALSVWVFVDADDVIVQSERIRRAVNPTGFLSLAGLVVAMLGSALYLACGYLGSSRPDVS